MPIRKVATVFTSIWLISSVAFSNGSSAPELPILTEAKSSAEYPILRGLQETTLELQLLEIAIKNRRDSGTEDKITGAIKEIETEGASVGQKFKTMRQEQLEGLFALFSLARRYGWLLGVAPVEWDELFSAIQSGEITSGTVTVHGRAGALSLFTLYPLYMGKQVVWNVSLPAPNHRSYWVAARSRVRAIAFKLPARLGNAALARRLAAANAPFAEAERLAKAYFTESYAKLYSTFENQRYAILMRLTMARKALVALGRSNTAMGTPEEYSSLYNRLLDNLFSYGIDVSLAGSQRDFAVKGFLFGNSPEAAQDLLRKLRFAPSSASYNSPSS